MEGYPHTCRTSTRTRTLTRTGTGKHTGMKARPLKALRQQKQQAAVCGLIAPTGRTIIELDMIDRSVSGTKCTDEFLAALTMTLIYRLFWSSRPMYYSTVKRKDERLKWSVVFFFPQAAEVKSKSETYIMAVSV